MPRRRRSANDWALRAQQTQHGPSPGAAAERQGAPSGGQPREATKTAWCKVGNTLSEDPSDSRLGWGGGGGSVIRRNPSPPSHQCSLIRVASLVSSLLKSPVLVDVKRNAPHSYVTRARCESRSDRTAPPAASAGPDRGPAVPSGGPSLTVSSWRVLKQFSRVPTGCCSWSYGTLLL